MHACNTTNSLKYKRRRIRRQRIALREEYEEIRREE
jgi:hypothetical protein